MVRREKPVRSPDAHREVNWPLIGYLVGGLVIIAVSLYAFWLVLNALGTQRLLDG